MARAGHVERDAHARPQAHAHEELDGWSRRGSRACRPWIPTRFRSSSTSSPSLPSTSPRSRTARRRYTVTTAAVQLQLLPPGFPTTTRLRLRRYRELRREPASRPDIRTAFTFPGPTFEAIRGRDIFVRYRNNLTGEPHLPGRSHDHGGQPQQRADARRRRSSPSRRATRPSRARSPIVTHLHGGVTPSDSDGFPFAWFTRERAVQGSGVHARRRSTTSTRSWRRRSGITTTRSG